jgi:hypothetical protein
MNSLRASLRHAAAALICACAVLAAACQTMPRVHAESAPGTDMARYATFGFFEKLGTDQHGYTTIATTHLKEAVSRELEARGMHPAANPDLLVNFYVQTKDKVESYPGSLGFGYSRFGWHGAGWGGGFAAPDVHTYTEGTLTIDLVDRQKNALAWQGVAVGRLSERALKQPAIAVNSAVNAVFDKYPVQSASRPAAGT